MDGGGVRPVGRDHQEWEDGLRRGLSSAVRVREIDGSPSAAALYFGFFGTVVWVCDCVSGAHSARERSGIDSISSTTATRKVGWKRDDLEVSTGWAINGLEMKGAKTFCGIKVIIDAEANR